MPAKPSLSVLLPLVLVVSAFEGCRFAGDGSNPSDMRFSDPTSRSSRAWEWKKSLIVLDARLSDLEALCRRAGRVSDDSLRASFWSSRLEYKRMEFLWESGFPAEAVRMNGAALDEVERDYDHTIIPAKGFQVLEERLFPERNTGPDSLALLVAAMRRVVREPSLNRADWTDSAVVEAGRAGLFRLSALGLTGFDSPLALASLEETRAALAGMDAVLTRWVFPAGDGLSSSAGWSAALRPTLAALSMDTDFDAFDRADFLTRRFTPLYAALVRFRDGAGIPGPREEFAFSSRTPDLFSARSWNVSFFAPPFAKTSGPSQVVLGRKLFFDPVLSGNGERSCATCHQPEKGFGDGLIKGRAMGIGMLDRHTPSLLHAGFQNAFFWDERAESLEDQADAVIHNPKEMRGSLESATGRLQKHGGYRGLFQSAFSVDGEAVDRDEPVSPLRIRRALAAYIRTLAPFDSPWDRYMGGQASAVPPDAKHGFNLFMGKAKCATCHFPPLYNGSVPPLYGVTEVEVLGVPGSTRPWILDTDPGRMAVDRVPQSKGAFKTPTVRNAAFTAPYMHNGIFATLEEVIDFYDAGGGAGLGLDVPNQTLPPDSLKLSQKEKRALISFLKALSDTSGTIPPAEPEPSAYAGFGKAERWTALVPPEY